jgi:hypothetical protein
MARFLKSRLFLASGRIRAYSSETIDRRPTGEFQNEGTAYAYLVAPLPNSTVSY